MPPTLLLLLASGGRWPSSSNAPPTHRRRAPFVGFVLVLKLLSSLSRGNDLGSRATAAGPRPAPAATQGLHHFSEILVEADGIILPRGNHGIDLHLKILKMALHKFNMAGKCAVVTCVMHNMPDDLMHTCADATDVENAVMDGSDAILLGLETLHELYPVDTISMVGRICDEFIRHALCSMTRTTASSCAIALGSAPGSSLQTSLTPQGSRT